MSEWKEYKLGDIAKIQTGPFGSQLHKSDYKSTGIPCIMPCNITANLDICCSNIAYISEEDADRLCKHKTQKGDIIYSRRGDIEKCAYISEKESGWVCGTGCLKVCINSEKANSKFIAYQLSTPLLKSWIVGNAVGTTMLNLNTSILSECPIPLPSFPTQQKIASILSSLDDKIEVNRRINEQLEELAQALFKSWFVDFEPFKDGEFVESELGMIPKGWTTISLSKMADYLNGLAMQKFRPLQGEKGLPVLKIKELGQDSCNETSELCSPSLVNEKYIVNDGDVIFSWSGTLLVKIWCGGVCGLNQHLFKVTSEKYPKWFIYLWTKYHLDRFIRIAKDKAVTMGHIKRGELDTSFAIVPNEEKMKEIDGLMASLIEQIIANNIEIHHLTTLRDTLLPKLMSGEIDVNEVEL